MFDSIRIILASGSPRRTELLSTAGIRHEVIVSGAEEDVREKDPRKLVEELSVRKAEAVFRTLDDAPVVVIGADTVVALDGEILGKPADEEDAFRMLRELSGRAHHVFTGVTLLGCIGGAEKIRTFSEESLVHVDDLTDEEIRAYLRTGEALDKAGAYGIQGNFMKHITGISGDYFNIVGLPVSRLYRELKSLV